MGGGDIYVLFKTDKWDHGKMVRSFARLGSLGDDSTQTETTKVGINRRYTDIEHPTDVRLAQDGKVVTHLLSPLSNDNWKSIRKDIEADDDRLNVPKFNDGTLSEEPSLYDVTRVINPNEGIILDANREIRAKLYMGQVCLSH